MPFIGSKNRPTKTCKQCKGGNFFSSAFGAWFKDAALRQSPDSMPLDEDDIIAIHEIWKRRKKYQGLRFIVEGDTSTYFNRDTGRYEEQEHGWHKDTEYHLCHLDPVKGDGYQGRLTAKNLIIASSTVNQSLGNKVFKDHGNRVYTDTPVFKDAEAVRAWCSKNYDLSSIAHELGLKSATSTNLIKSVDITMHYLTESQVLIEEIKRLGGSWSCEDVKSPHEASMELLKQGISGIKNIEERYGEYYDF
ncbi:hypothetical protein FMH07_00365 [Vibrio parahaemolyticus]|nr:hypothetical protein [Vibrio parahaemolyticus]